MTKRKAKKNIYTHQIDLTPIKIKNQSQEKFRESLEQIKYKGYEVEQLKDGRKIVITKPGGKFSFGVIRRNDFMVWIYNDQDDSLWLISHKNILDDLEEKAAVDSKETIRIIDALERVCNGEEPDIVLDAMSLKCLTGELPEALLKAYKWIWGQEDCNYPPPKYQGREMSMIGIRELRDKISSGDTEQKVPKKRLQEPK